MLPAFRRFFGLERDGFGNGTRRMFGECWSEVGGVGEGGGRVVCCLPEHFIAVGHVMT